MSRILIIDDEPSVRRALRRILEKFGHEITEAGDGAAGVAACALNVPDLIITDIIMPKMNGIDAVTAIRQANPGVRILAISGGGNFEPQAYKPEAITTSAYLAAAERSGADAVMTKPFDRSQLMEKVDALLARSA
jgi:two-component system chemotaxis response regulator CheY